jgi:(+)-trans-carveol dehydrogenase
LARSPDGSAGGQSRGRQRRGARAGSRPRAAACARGRHIIAIDICADIDTVDYPLATPEDLDDTVAQVELLGRRVAASETDVRDATAVAAAIDTGVAKLGRLDIVVTNAGIAMYDAADTMSAQSWRDMIDTNPTGVWTVCRGAMPHMIRVNTIHPTTRTQR